MKRKTASTILQLLIFSALGGGIVWYMLSRMSTGDRRIMVDAIKDTNLLWLVPFFFTYLLSHWARAKRWMVMLDPVGIHPTTVNTTFAVLIGYLVNLIPPRAGEVAKCTVLAEYENMPADKMIGTIVAERSFDVICLLLVIAIGVWWQGAALNIREELHGHVPTTATLLMWIGGIALIVVVLIGIYRRNKGSRVGRFIGGLGAGFTSIFHLRKRGMFLFYTALIWAAYMAEIIFGFKAMHATESLGLGVALMTLIFGSAAIIASPGGIGLYPFLIGKLLHNGYGLSLPAANAFGWVSWMALTVATLISGVASLILLPFTTDSHMIAKLQWIQSKILSREVFAHHCAAMRAAGRSVVFTNGCFDLLHRGHIDYLARAASFGNALVIGVNTDASVRRLKGPLRPVNNEQDRAFALASLLVVESVCLFDEDTPAELIEAIRPDVLAKGGDYTIDTIVGAREVQARGGRVELIPFVEGYSTTGLIERIHSL